VRRHGDPIQKAGVRHRLSHGITISSRYEQFEAAIKAGLDLERWRAGGYDRALMADVVAWSRLQGLIEAHLEDARSRDMDRRAARKGR
jgi:hypothetical protein